MGKKKDLEIIYNLQWKNKPANGGNGDKANIIGMYDIPATTLNWTIFKSYLLKNSGYAGDDVRVSYVTTNDREFPIDSQTDFQIALYSFRRRARLGEIINLTLDRIADKESAPSTSKASQKTMDVETQIESNEAISMTSSSFNTPPEWFLTLMAQYKKEIVDEVTASVSNIVSNIKPHTVTQSSCYHSRKSKIECPKRRKLPHLVGESSNDKDLLKSLKLEFKLENKLEKLERKTKKIKEKKLALFTKSSDSDAGHSSSRSRSNHVQDDDMEDELQLDAAPVNDQTIVPHMLGGEVYMHRWEVMNVGKAPWTSKTTLNFAWGSKTFQPLDTIVSCPYLKPMEKGSISVRFQVPRESGRYESYWRFHHKGRRFGQWLGCQVTVDPFDLRGHSSVLETSAPSAPEIPSSVNSIYPELCVKPINENRYTMNIKEDKPIIVEKEEIPVKQNLFNQITKGEDSDSDHTDLSFDTETDEVFTKKKIEPELAPSMSDSMIDEMVKKVIARVEDLSIPELNNEDEPDNFSVASATDSNSSKNEEFVVIPTPNCFKLDEGGEDEVKIENTDVADGEKASTSAENYDDNNNTEDTNQNSSSESISRVEDEIPSEASQKSDMVIVNLPSDQEIDAKGYAYLMVDGVAIPVPKKYLKEEYLNSAGEETAKPSPTPDKTEALEEEIQVDSAIQANVEQEQENADLSHCSATGSCFSDARELPQRWFIFPQTVPGYEVVNSCNKPETAASDVTQSTPNFPNEHTEYVSPLLSHYTQQPASAPVYYPQSYPMDLSSAHSPRPQHVPEYYNIPPNSQEGSEVNRAPEHFQRMHNSPGNVQILPESLMSGVVNVASSAINTARSVINIMKPSEPGRWVNGHWVATVPDSPREANLRALAEMGFWDRDLNATLLQRYNDDLSRVVSELVQ